MTYVLGQSKVDTDNRIISELDSRITYPFSPVKPPIKPPIKPPPDDLQDGIEEVTEQDRIDTDLEDQYTEGEMPTDDHEPFVPPEEGYPEVGEQPVDQGMEYPDVGDEYVATEEDQPVEAEEVVVVEEEKKFPWLAVGAGVGVGAIALFYLLKKKK